ncbi:MAG: hypothetical protein H6563_12900 [Lewinellaceae bacterium]|nr:hypothetical protein [Lewinellaceae bacterium]
MSQYTWTYVGGGGKNYRVTLFHGKRTGHVLILLNMQVLQIDFNVAESKTYSFFIEDEFCEIRLERRGDEMYYFFEINKEVDTPRNKARKKRERKHLGQTLLFFAALIVLASAMALGLRAHNKKIANTRWSEKMYSDLTVGWVEIDSLHAGTISYQYIAGNRPYSGFFFEDENRGDTLPLFPLRPGDEFVVRYNPTRPDMSRIFFSQPTESQEKRYVARTLDRYMQYHPDEHPVQVRCLLELALEMRGLSGLADLYYQEESTVSSPLHNRDSYYRLVRDPDFQQALSKRCWD